MTDIEYYNDFIPAALLERLDSSHEPVAGVPCLRVARGLQEAFPRVETPDALAFTCEVYRRTRDHLNRVLEQRGKDRKFMDDFTAECVKRNAKRDFHDPEYETVVGAKDAEGRVVVGPIERSTPPKQVDVPEFLKGDQVTLFGPPDSAKLSINAMNALHRIPANEPEIVTMLVEESGIVPRWGADNEDSKTPIMSNFLAACENLMGCFDGTIRFEDKERGKVYELADDKLSIPIKRFPGLALPDGNHILDGSPLPLHLYDFAMHIFHNWRHEQALVFYVPKLENEEEAAYIHDLVNTAENLIAEQHPEYKVGAVRLFIVFENPRAIFRITEISDALYPYFVGGSLGWHDFLGSTARLFRNDPRYRIPVKADPNIVINHIRESHKILVEKMDSCGGLKIGGMYGVLYEDGNPKSYDVSMAGYIRDVMTQLKRGLDGFWVAHPDFVRTGIAMVQAWRNHEQDHTKPLIKLIQELVPGVFASEIVIAFVLGRDVPGLDETDPLYPRAVLAASLEMSDVIANYDPEEVRYNVFQALQYLADWLSGNGCVALPATMINIQDEEVFVRIMDDLATTERSRWELWAEVAHGRVSLAMFQRILDEEYAFIQAGEDADDKRIQVPWDDTWYPIAKKVLHQLVTSKTPVEFATELLMPITFDIVRDSDDPWTAAYPQGIS